MKMLMVRVVAIGLMLGLWGVVSVGMVGQVQAPPTAAVPALPMTVEKAGPAIPEVTTLKIQNAILRANVALGQLQATPAWKVYQQAATDAEKLIKAEVAAFEKEHAGYTIDTAKMVAIKKPAEKGK